MASHWHDNEVFKMMYFRQKRTMSIFFWTVASLLTTTNMYATMLVLMKLVSISLREPVHEVSFFCVRNGHENVCVKKYIIFEVKIIFD